tara:strand:+ start:49 stop:387 length:339 start_codon:yes stop_codon:yes gene_type:complete
MSRLCKVKPPFSKGLEQYTGGGLDYVGLYDHKDRQLLIVTQPDNNEIPTDVEDTCHIVSLPSWDFCEKNNIDPSEDYAFSEEMTFGKALEIMENLLVGNPVANEIEISLKIT